MRTAVLLLGVFAVLRLVRAFALKPASGDSFAPVPDRAALDGLVATSTKQPVVLFLHDPYCPISGGAYRKMAHLDADVHLIDVSRQNDLSGAVERLTGIRHESPQVIVLRNGAPLYDASHGRISAAEIDRVLTASPAEVDPAPAQQTTS